MHLIVIISLHYVHVFQIKYAGQMSNVTGLHALKRQLATDIMNCILLK